MLSRAADSPLVRGGLTLAAGVLTGNVLGFVRVAITAYLLGTHSRADSLAVAMGPLDTLNSLLINSMVFTFVPLLAARTGAERIALFLRLRRVFAWAFAGVSTLVVLLAPYLMRVFAPGLDPHYVPTAVMVLRIMALSTAAAGVAAVHCALLFTDRRFAPAAFYQAALNVFTVAGALTLWRWLGVYAFAIGYSAGAWAQLAIVWFAARRDVKATPARPAAIGWLEVLTRPAFFVAYAAGLGLNIIFTRAWATNAGPGAAAALDYCMRGVGVPVALLVSPITNSLLPEIARLRSAGRVREAFRLIDRTMVLTAAVAAGGCVFALLFCKPVVALLFQRGSFTSQSTALVAAVYLGLGPSLVGWTLMEVASRSLFALGRPWLPLLVAAVPVLLNVAITLNNGSLAPKLLGAGASVGFAAGFAVLYAGVRVLRPRWLERG
jgi:putative peptidoglycan lipid II flippase